MDSHERYMHLSTTDLSILEIFDITFKTEPFTILHRLIRNYDKQLNENTLDIKKLETFRTILCYEYQLVFNSETKYERREPNDLCFKKIENVLNLKKQFQNDNDLTILYDITTLYTLLFCNLQCFEQHVTNFQRSQSILLSENENRGFYMKILESFLDSICLKRLLNYDNETELQLTLDLHYLQDIKILLELKDNSKWSTFASIFPKIIRTFGSEKVLPTLQSFIFINMKDMEDQLSALSIIVDTYCLEEFKVTCAAILDTLRYDEPLWLLIMRSLKSSVPQYRKQGLFLMKRIINFSRISDSSTLNLQKTTVVPFLCTQSVKTEISINDIKQKFYLVLEALEEKRYHLIAPALTNVSNLIKGCEEHTLCNKCFSTMWLQLIFERILKHQNNTVMKQGILYVCKYHKVLNNTEFLKLFINVLNNTFLYECQLYQKGPEILDEIITLFVLMKNTEVEFISRLLKVIDEETWAPIPLFYMMVIIRTVTERTLTVLVEDDLITIKSFIQKNLHAHARIFRVASQIELIRTISMALDKIDNLKSVVYMLLEFPSDEAFIRSSFSWNNIISCLNIKVTKEEAASFINVLCEDCMHQDIYLRISPRKFASIIFMLYDAELILYTKHCVAEQILHKWLSLIDGCDIRPYANVEHIFYIIEVISHLLNLSVKENKRIIQLFSEYIDDVLQFLLKNSKSIPFKYGYEEVNKYMITIASFLKHGNLILPKSDILDYVEKFKCDSITILKNIEEFTNMHYMYALYILHCTQSILNPKPAEFYEQPLINICQIDIFDNNKNHKNSTGKLVSYCYLLLAKLTNQFLLNVEIKLWPENVDWLKNVKYIYEMGRNEIIPEIATILKVIVDKGGIRSPENMSNLISIFNVCWLSTSLNSKNKLYFLSAKELLRVIVNNNFLAIPYAINTLNPFFDQFLEESNKVPKLKSILLNEMKLLNVCNLSKLQEPLLQCMLHGYALRKDKQIENQTCSYITKNFETFYPSQIPIIDHNSDASIRALSVILLHKTITADVRFASAFLPIVLQKLEKYKNKRYFNHSYTHKIKHRIMQILLILHPILNKVDTTNLGNFLLNLLLLESNQHSVRLMQEWLLIKICVQNENFRYELWSFFEETILKRPGCVGSIACIFYHVAKLLPEVDRTKFIYMGLPYLSRYCLGPQYNMRLYNQVVFVNLFDMVEPYGDFTKDCINEYRGLFKTILKNFKDERTHDNFFRIQNDFYLSTFHALHDYSLQTIYCELPRLTDMDQSEWISPLIFEQLNFKESHNHPLQIYNPTDLLSKIETSIYIAKSTTDSEFLKKSETNLEELNNIQKKIDPLISANLSQNFISSSIRESISQKKLLLHGEGIIVVACLIDRKQNLGGLARTCEIFNVKELVIANLSQIRDKDFQNLSVSAENWINIREVKPHELSKYLLGKRYEGWSLIGVEQTVNSVSLLNMKFKKKTVLVLGNEKDGVPANLIPLFDTCIEIPQLGIIRSLNVHVCGAICIWQYAMQHTF